MSIQTLQTDVSRKQRELSDLQKKEADEIKKEAEKGRRLQQIQGSITKSTSASSLDSKQREIVRVTEELSQIRAKRASIGRQMADKTEQLHRSQRDLAAEEERERKKQDELERRRHREQLERQKAITQELERQGDLSRQSEAFRLQHVDTTRRLAPSYDFFISHATEDKEDFARPLAEELRRLNVSVWYDEFVLKVGDSLRKSIDYGLANSRYGIVVLSAAFFAKNWPQYELDGLVAREMSGNRKVLLPIWHKVTKDEVLQFSPTLADKVALNSSTQSIAEIAKELAALVQP